MRIDEERDEKYVQRVNMTDRCKLSLPLNNNKRGISLSCIGKGSFTLVAGCCDCCSGLYKGSFRLQQFAATSSVL